MGQMIKFCTLTGLRHAGAVESIRLLNSVDLGQRYYYPERQALEHFRFPNIFLRQTKKAYISFVTPEMLNEVVVSSYGTDSSVCNNDKNRWDSRRVPTYNAIRLACLHSGTRCDMRYCRKTFASWLHKGGISDILIDLLQGSRQKCVSLSLSATRPRLQR